MSKSKKDISAELGLVGTTTGAGMAGGAVYTLAGGSASASAITYALAAIGGYFGGGMAVGLAAIIGVPFALGAGGYALGRILSNNGTVSPLNSSSKMNMTSYPKSKNLDKKRQPLAQTYKKVYMLNKVKDFVSDYLSSTRPEIPETSRSETIYNTFLNPSNLYNTLNNPSVQFFSKRVSGLLKVIQDKSLTNKDRDRVLFLISWLTLMFYLVHFCDVDCAGEEDEMYDLLDLIDSYIGAMSYRTPEALFLYYVANMFSADRIENSIPSAKLKEFRQILSQIQLDESLTEFKPSGWKGIEDTIYGIMKRIIS